jgi:hypothetical protein
MILANGLKPLSGGHPKRSKENFWARGTGPNYWKWLANVRFGSETDILRTSTDVRFTRESDIS